MATKADELLNPQGVPRESPGSPPGSAGEAATV